MNNRNRHHRRGTLLAAVVTLLAILSALMLFAASAERGQGGGLLDSRVTCDKLGPKACDPTVAAWQPSLARAPLQEQQG